VATALALFTRDLRVRDNPVLDSATAGSTSVAPLFVFDREMLDRTAHGRPNRFGFLCQSLVDLDGSLRDRGGRLIVRRGDWVQEVLQVAYECRAQTIHVARDVSAYAQRRADALEQAASAAGVRVVWHESITVVPPSAFAKPYVVFTPYYRRWVASEWRALARLPRRLNVPASLGSATIPDQSPPGEWVGGETAALTQFKAWTAHELAHYDARRDDLGGDHTSHISAALHFGCLSPVEIASRLWERPGSEAFLRQLSWRDFFAQLLSARPEVAHRDVHDAPRQWTDDPVGLARWKEGRTGVKLVDAGMRQLLTDGWMPNRVRMVTASFLTKQLGIDWRRGAAHFMDHLVDGDVANNQLNWQWVAGTGTDQRPHRGFNPELQAQKHDPDGIYVKKWLKSE
jgi:deoxyribodipyrimidine photo-lyase